MKTYTKDEILKLGAVVDRLFGSSQPEDQYQMVLKMLFEQDPGADPDTVLTDFMCSYVGAPIDEVNRWLQEELSGMPALQAHVQDYVAMQAVAQWRIELAK